MEIGDDYRTVASTFVVHRINNQQNPMYKQETGKGIFRKLDSMLPDNVDIIHIDSYTYNYQGHTNRFQGVFYDKNTKKIIECPFEVPKDSFNGQISYTIYNC